MPEPICQTRLPIKPWLDPRLSRMPGVVPLDWQDWIIRDDAFAAQMAYRDRLLAQKRDAVFACHTNAEAAASELRARVLADLRQDTAYRFDGARVTRPDGKVVDIKEDHPLVTIGRLAQEDYCILLDENDSQILRGAVLCFPASWTLSEKINRDMFAIHQPVDSYGEDMGKRVGRMFRMIRPEQPLWRANNLVYSNPDLFQPRIEGEERIIDSGKRWVRVERQTMMRLPESGALVFGIHTFQVPLETLEQAEAAALLAAKGL